MAKSAKEAPVEVEAPVKPKSKRLLLAAIALLILGSAGGGVWFFLKDTMHNESKPVVEQSAFVVLEPYTVNLQHDEGDQYLNIGITLKVVNVETGDRIRQRMPELRSRLLFLLSSKHASELMPVDGKKKLAQEIIVEANSILGTGARTASGREGDSANGAETASAAEAVPAHGKAGGKGVLDVLFTSFIIQ